jgi:tetrahydromethanopterin S-methyltransferase subunit G
MASDVTREEHNQLVARVDVLEREVEGEKMVNRHILEQTRRNSDDLAGIKTRLDRVETRLDRVEGKMDGLVQEVGKLGSTLHSLVRDLPTIVSDAVRKASPKRGSKR